MYTKLLEEMGKRLEIDKQGRIFLGKEFANNEESWFLYYDLVCEKTFILCSEAFDGEGLVKAYIKPITIDEKGRCYIPSKFREKINGSLLLKRHKHFVIIFNQEDDIKNSNRKFLEDQFY